MASAISDVIGLAVFTNGEEAQQVTIACDQLYPAMLAVIVGDTQPQCDDGIDRDHYARWLARVRTNARAMADAFLPPDEVPAERLAARFEVLELARKWFTSELVRFLGTSDFRLHLTVDWIDCESCESSGKVEAGSTGIQVDCPICAGRGATKVPSPFREKP